MDAKNTVTLSHSSIGNDSIKVATAVTSTKLNIKCVGATRRDPLATKYQTNNEAPMIENTKKVIVPSHVLF
jgi:hypothetical protein